MTTCPVCGAYADGDAFCPADGTTLRAADADGELIGSVVADRYPVADPLGEGGMGEVYLARHVRLPQQTAVEVLRPDPVRGAAAVARCTREAANAGRSRRARAAAAHRWRTCRAPVAQTPPGTAVTPTQNRGPSIAKHPVAASHVPSERAHRVVARLPHMPNLMLLPSGRAPRAVRSLVCAAGLFAVAACGGGGGGDVTPPPPANTTATFNVAAQFVVASSTTGLSLRVTPAYELAAGGTRALPAPAAVTVASAAAQTIPVTVDITSCLNDAARAGATTTGTPSCRVVLQYTLLSGTREVDTQTSGAFVVASGSPAATASVTFTEVTGVRVTNASGTVLADAAAVRAEVGAGVTLTATALRADGATSTRAVTWSSDNTAVAEVNAATGAITPKAAGTARITAAAGDVRSAVVLTVVPGPAAVAVTVAGGAGSGTVTSAPAGINCRVTAGAAAGSGCSAPFASDAAVTLTAAPDAGTTFGGWGGDCASAGTNLQCALAASNGAPRNVTARFNAQRALTVTLAGSGIGRVTSVPAGIDCSTNGTPGCSGAFGEGASVTLTAAAVTNSTFAGWSGAGCSGTGPCTVTMSQAQAVTATFTGTPRPVPFDVFVVSSDGTARQLSLAYSGFRNGTPFTNPSSVSIDLSTANPAPQFTLINGADEGTNVTVTVRPLGSSRVVSWGGVCAGTVVTAGNTTCTFRQRATVAENDVRVTLGP